ncbi:MAG: lipase family protein [Gammaproteobacteria bacterium]|nr:lipase family protein [Gammaproteobacteria bacterium]
MPSRLPEDDFESRVHTGFFEGFKSVREQISSGIEEARQRLGEQGQGAPVYFTGHSLGGALAMIATRELAFDSCGACYTFGAPRAADYNYFWRMKTPHYRVVNSSDMVPRVPPGAEIVLLDTLLRGIGYFTKHVPVAREGVDMRGLVDRLHHYRHAGDQRYLTDVAAVASGWRRAYWRNPSVIDRTQWLWRHLSVSGLGTPIKSHSVKIYRRKLAAIARARLT